MYKGGAPVPSVMRCEEIVGWTWFDKISVRFVQNQRNIVLGCELRERPNERRRVCYTCLVEVSCEFVIEYRKCLLGCLD